MTLRKTLAMLVVGLVPLCAFAHNDSAKPDLTLMCWNIQQPKFTDWDARSITGIWPTMIAEHADFMCLQEVTSQQLIQTMCHLDKEGLSYDWIGYGRKANGAKVDTRIRERIEGCSTRDRRYGRGGERCTILWNREKYEYAPVAGQGYEFEWDANGGPATEQEPHTFWLTNDPALRWKPGIGFDPDGPVSNSAAPPDPMQRAGFPRVCTWGRFRNRETGQHVYIYNTHLDHESEPSRRAAVRQILEHVRHIATTTNDPIIVAGDFNLQPPSIGYRYITEGETEQNDPFLNESMITLENVSGTSPTYGDDEKRIDYVFLGEGITALRHEVLHPGEKSSDHRPIRVDFDFERTSRAAADDSS